jgi:hypothetical protein
MKYIAERICIQKNTQRTPTDNARDIRWNQFIKNYALGDERRS